MSYSNRYSCPDCGHHTGDYWEFKDHKCSREKEIPKKTALDEYVDDIKKRHRRTNK